MVTLSTFRSAAAAATAGLALVLPACHKKPAAEPNNGDSVRPAAPKDPTPTQSAKGAGLSDLTLPPVSSPTVPPKGPVASPPKHQNPPPMQPAPSVVKVRDGENVKLEIPKKGETVSYYYEGARSSVVVFTAPVEKGTGLTYKMGAGSGSAPDAKMTEIDLPTQPGSNMTMMGLVSVGNSRDRTSVILNISESAPPTVRVRVVVTNGKDGVKVVVAPQLR